ncbi:AraC-like DNA-binding protein [Nocardioides sp. J9]|uniref:helix-turn-helix domain-containing protein n=1 Tax=Nocardioides sp. J9 TaxID=935844 RepID=UPI0011ABE4DF|nr:helix-turn-helix domain-containing protein [Nocardioides sp. J9]TWH04188.1 AraC-like DNA-binding protein [Nocardioides sp. J9]
MLLFESTELGETEEFLNEHYAPMRIGSTGPTRARIARGASDGVTVDRVEFDFVMSYDVEPLGRIGLCDVRTGKVEDHGPDGSVPESFGPGELFSLAPPDRSYRGTINRSHYSVTMVDLALLSEVAAPTGRAESIQLLDHRPVDAAAAQRLRGAIDHLDRVVLSDPVAAANPLVLGTASRYVAAQLLGAFATTADPGGTSDSRDAHPAALRRAMAFIEENAHLDLSPAEIATAAHVSIRALQHAFRRHLDTTPTAYLREVRLARARRDLRAAEVGGTTVAEIAARWGFSHQGHFGQAYRRLFDETPGTTLRS